MAAQIFSIGHSTRPLEDFLSLLRQHDISILADVRTVPKSRRHPHFGRDELSASLAKAGVRYEHLPELGGLRRPRADSINDAWRNESFRGYADYMDTEAFSSGLEKLMALANEGTLVMMCAEAVPWRCHRSLIADALFVRGVEVWHIIGPNSVRPHTLTSFAKVEDTRVTYPAPLFSDL